ncbi:MAG: GDSL-type esterase/lipase family protein [Candidatus Saccharibacteria bacterium]|nr:GDSL-type esterase/lipase family protein [Candidatus Saccharibacteria bacterium]
MKILMLVVLVVLVAEAAALLVLKSQVARYDAHWERVAARESPEDALTYLALGDSAAQGIGATSPQRGYVGLIAKSLENKHQRPVHTINISKTGARLQDCIDEQLPRLTKLSPDVVTIQIGANNMKDFSPDNFQKRMNTIMQALPEHAAISDIPYFGGGRHRGLEDNVLRANQIIHGLAKKHRLSVAPLHEFTKDRDSLLTYSADLFHPGNIGYKNWHDAFWSVFNRD